MGKEKKRWKEEKEREKRERALLEKKIDWERRLKFH
jgi:hypothetical protein